MPQVDDFMKFLILHCFYHYFLHHNLTFQIDDVVQLLILHWFYHYYLMFQYNTFMSFLLLGLPISQGALQDPQGPPRASKDTPRTPQGPPKDVPGTPKDPPRTPQAGNLMKFYIDLIHCHQIISIILRSAHHVVS